MAVLSFQKNKSAIENPDPQKPVFLIHGQDQGLIYETTQKLIQTLWQDKDPLSRVTLTCQDLIKDPQKLYDELFAIGLFGSSRIIHIKISDTRAVLKNLKSLEIEKLKNVFLIIEAQDLKKTNALRKFIETHKACLSIACYEDESRNIKDLIQQEINKYSLSIERNALEELEHHLGQNRGATRAEIKKLCLYCLHNKTITLEDVIESVGDVSAHSIDKLIDAALLGKKEEMLFQWDALIEKNNNTTILILLEKHLQNLHALKAKTSNKASIQQIIKSARPPIFFKRQKNIIMILEKWTEIQLTQALLKTHETMLETRKNAALAPFFINRLLLQLSKKAA